MGMVATMASGWHVAVLPLFMAVMGFLGSASATLFSLVSGHFDRSLTGRASTALNLLVFLGGFCFSVGHWSRYRVLGWGERWRISGRGMPGCIWLLGHPAGYDGV